MCNGGTGWEALRPQGEGQDRPPAWGQPGQYGQEGSPTVLLGPTGATPWTGDPEGQRGFDTAQGKHPPADSHPGPRSIWTVQQQTASKASVAQYAGSGAAAHDEAGGHAASQLTLSEHKDAKNWLGEKNEMKRFGKCWKGKG